MTDYSGLLIEQRRELHKWPEEGWTEFWTTAYIAERLRKLGFEVLLGKKIINEDAVFGRDPVLVAKAIEKARERGVSESLFQEMEEYSGAVGILDTGREGPTTGLRFDIDCVCVGETEDPSHLPTKEGFRSEQAGLMHSCGHDAHASVGLAIAKWLAENKGSLRGKFKLVFQPAEEGVRGAWAIAASGIADDCDYMIGSHVSVIAGTGEVIANAGGLLCTTKLDVSFQGKPAHAGKEPNVGRNALHAACSAVMQMMGIPRHGEGMTRINVGRLIAGEGRNVIPTSAHLALEVRGETAAINKYLEENIRRICAGTSMSFDVTHDVKIMGAAVDFDGDPELGRVVEEVAEQVPGVTKVLPDGKLGGSDDFSILGRRVQEHGGKAVYFIYGADRTAGHHQAEFDFDEKALPIGFEITKSVLQKLNG